MKINKKLVQAVAFNPTEKAHKMTVLDMCKKIENLEIVLPLYQRDMSWTLKQSIALLNYQLLGKAPIAPLSMNEIDETEDNVPQISFIDREMLDIDQVKKAKLSVVDGQQRLTANYKAYVNSDDFRSVVLDAARGKIMLVDGAFTRSQIPIGMLLNKDDSVFYDYMNKNHMMKNTELMTLFVQCRSKVRNYYYTINQADNLSEDEQIQWFEVLNNAGSSVSALQMKFSKMKVHGIDIYKIYTSKFKEKLMEYGYDFFSPKKTDVTYPIAALNSSIEKSMGKTHTDAYAPIPSDTKPEQICTMCAKESEKLLQCFKMTLEALDKSIDFIMKHDVEAPDRIDYINYLTGYYVYNPDPTFKQTNELIKWYHEVDFNNKSNSRRRAIFTELLEI